MFNVPAIQEALEAAGINNIWADSTGGLTWDATATQQQKDQAAAIIAAHNPATLSQQQEIDEARAAIAQFRIYLAKLLVKSTADTVEQIVDTVKPAVDGNVYLTRAMQRWLFVLRLSEGWTSTVAAIMTPTTDENRARYIRAAKDVSDALNA